MHFDVPDRVEAAAIGDIEVDPPDVGESDNDHESGEDSDQDDVGQRRSRRTNRGVPPARMGIGYCMVTPHMSAFVTRL